MASNIRIKMIEPSRYLANGRLLRRQRMLLPPALTFPLLAALTPTECQVEVVYDKISTIDFNEPTDIAAITSYTTNISRAYEIADQFRRRNVHVVMGGVHVSYEPDEALAHSDTVVIGEAEQLWPRFIDDFTRGKAKAVYRQSQRPDLAGLPIPRFELVERYHFPRLAKHHQPRFPLTPIIPVQTARGCPNSCDFCTVTHFFGGQYRPRPLDEVVAEIKNLGARLIFFVDDNIFADPPRAKALLRALIPLRVHWMGQAPLSAGRNPDLLALARQSGCIGLSTGMESLSDLSLAFMGKTINQITKYEESLAAFRKNGISIAVSMMYGFATDDADVFKRSYQFLLRNRVPISAWWIVRPYPGTRFFQRLKKAGRLKHERWWLGRQANLNELKFSGLRIAEDVFYRELLAWYRRLFSLASILRRILLPPQKKWWLKLLVNLLFRRSLKSDASLIES